MKKIFYIISFLVANALFMGCDTNDNTFYKDVFVDVPDLVHIQVPLGGYHVNDKLFIDASIPKLLSVPGQTNLLDVRQTTGNAPSINFTYLLERRISADEWELVNFDPSAITVVGGSISSGSFYLASATFYPLTNNYYFEAGIPLLVAGEYRLSFGYNSTETSIIELRSESMGDNLFLNINTTEDIA